MNNSRRNVNKILIIYSKKTGKIRRIIDADNNSEYKEHENNKHDGEGFLYLTHQEYEKNFIKLQEFISKKINLKIPELHETRHAHVDHNGNVINIIEADLSCGDSGDHLGKNHKIIQHPTAKIGWKYKNGDLVE
jgi:hypothetical protein